MNKQAILLSAAMLLLGSVGGFLIANSINRTQLNALRSELENTKATSISDTSEGPNLSDDEIHSAIAKADQNANDLSLQRNVGISLYRWGAMKKDAALISEAARILERAIKLAPEDND